MQPKNDPHVEFFSRIRPRRILAYCAHSMLGLAAHLASMKTRRHRGLGHAKTVADCMVAAVRAHCGPEDTKHFRALRAAIEKAEKKCRSAGRPDVLPAETGTRSSDSLRRPSVPPGARGRRSTS